MNTKLNAPQTPAFELDENVLVNLANMPAKVVMISSDGQTVNVVFGDGYEAHTVPVTSVTRPMPSRFKVGDPVEVGQVGVPAKVVSISADGLTLEVVYEDMVEVFEVDACNTTLLTDKPKAVVHRVAELERQVAELQRQVATLLPTINPTPRS
ncbi:MAG: hypothetical protein HY862_07050 [Chloroflexi bacterium]|nr:hypothetical protein [Chloroflexota bacterium]